MGIRRFFCFGFSIFLFLLIFSQAVYARDKSDEGKVYNQTVPDDDVMTMWNIDKLIRDTNYDKALDELHKYIKANPEKFDNAQIRIQRIMNARNRYSELAQELINVIIEEPDNSEKIYKITSELEALEKYPSDKQLAFIKQTHIAAKFNFFRKEFDRIQGETLRLVENKSYVQAVEMAKTGFYLYQDEFFESQSDENIAASVRAALSDIDLVIPLYADLQKRLNDSVNAYVKAVDSDNRAEIPKAYQNVKNVFAEFALLRNRVYAAGILFQDTHTMLAAFENDEISGDASFLPFVSRFTLGQTENPNTGMAGAMDSQWESLCLRMENEIVSKLDGFVAAYEKLLPEKLFDSRDDSVVLNSSVLSDITVYSGYGDNIAKFYADLTPAMKTENSDNPGDSFAFIFNLVENLNGMFAIRNGLLQNQMKIAGVSKPSDFGAAELAGSDYAQRLWNAALSASVSGDVKTNLDLNSAEWAKGYEFGGEDDKLLGLENIYTGYVSELEHFSENRKSETILEICGYFTVCDENYVASARQNYESADLFFKGISSDDTFTTEKRPDKSLELSSQLQSDIDQEVIVLDRHLSFLEILSEHGEITATKNAVQQNKRDLLALKSSANELASLSSKEVMNANRALNEAELRLSQAERALAGNSFDTARRRLQESRSKYNESLSFCFSPEIQAQSDEKLASLGVLINQRENEVIVREVRDLKTRAKNEYYNGNFEDAETLLVQARTRWAVTNVEEDMEITNLLAIVSTALSMKTGRVILPSAPLYPEMSQILSIATQYYNDGSALIEKGQKSEGKNLLENALSKLQELQLVYPLNQEASLLTLRIQKVLNPADFDQMFERKLQAAKVNYKVRETQLQAYVDLQDLAEINPNYPGLKTLIYNVEIEIGVRQKPVDNSAQTRSTNLTREAQRIVDSAGGDEDKLKDALSKLDQAISLNPNNNTAIKLKDQIQTNIGGKAAVVLTSEDEAKYQRAIQELQKNNIITANAIVEQLLQKSSNKKSAKILELQRKIKALL